MSSGWDKDPNYIPKQGFWRNQLLIIGLLLIGVVTIFLVNGAKAETLDAPIKINSIYWSDADSGRLNGNIKFRLNSVDAPETGGIGAAIGGAKCELERERGYKSKEWIVGVTKEADVSITRDYGFDKYDRLIIDLDIAEGDLGQFGVLLGHLRPWPHKGTKALSKKPDWC